MRKWKAILTDLKKELNVDLVRTRKVGNTVIPYLEGDVVIQTANRIFGHDGWSVTPQGPVERFEVGIHTKNNKESVTFTYTIPVLCEFHGLLEDGAVHTIRKGDVGKNSTYSAALPEHEMAISGCATDALKRSMRHLGNQFGLTLYDKNSEDFQAVMAAANAGTGASTRKTSTKKKREPAKRKTSGTRKRRETTKAKKKKEEDTTELSPKEILDVMYDRAMAYKLPLAVRINGQDVKVPEGGKLISKAINSSIAINIFTWLAGLRSSPNNLAPYEPTTDEEQNLQNALRHVLSSTELSAQLTDEELAIVGGE